MRESTVDAPELNVMTFSVVVGVYVKVVVALGKIAFDAFLQLWKTRGIIERPRPAFTHGRESPHASEA